MHTPSQKAAHRDDSNNGRNLSVDWLYVGGFPPSFSDTSRWAVVTLLGIRDVIGVASVARAAAESRAINRVAAVAAYK